MKVPKKQRNGFPIDVKQRERVKQPRKTTADISFG